jgi:hypothetical protein
MLYAWPVQSGGGAPASDVWMSFWPDRKQNLYVRPVGDGALWV